MNPQSETTPSANLRVIFSSRCELPASSFSLLFTKAFSAGVNHAASSGKSAMRKNRRIATTQDSAPSRHTTVSISSYDGDGSGLGCLPRMNTHRHARNPRIPSIFPIAVASSPPNAPAKLFDPKKKAHRLSASSRRYHLKWVNKS